MFSNRCSEDPQHLLNVSATTKKPAQSINRHRPRPTTTYNDLTPSLVVPVPRPHRYHDHTGDLCDGGDGGARPRHRRVGAARGNWPDFC